MKRILFALAALAFAALTSAPAEAVTCTWQGGTATWNGVNTASWSCGHVPATTDDVVLDGTSGGGTVTVNTTVSVNSLTMGAFTGTLDFSVNNNNVTINGSSGGEGFNCSGTGTRTLNMGNGTWTLAYRDGNMLDFSTTTGLTFNANSSTIVVTPATAPDSNRNLNLGGLTFNTITINSGGFSRYARVILTTGTIGTLTINGGTYVFLNNNLTIQTALNLSGTAYNNVATLTTLDAGTKTLTLNGTASMNWAAIGGITFTGSPISNNSFDLGGNSGITINGPSGGGGRIIGG